MDRASPAEARASNPARQQRRIRLMAVLLTAILTAAFAGSSALAQKQETLTLMFWGDPAAPSYWQGIVDDFKANGHPNANVEFIHQPDEYETKLQTLIAAGQEPDVFLLASGSVQHFAQEGVLLDQQPLYDAAGIDVEELVVEPAIWRNGDQLVGVASSLNSIILFYDKAAFDKAGLPYPPDRIEDAWSWDQFVDVAGRLSSGEGVNRTWGVYVAPWMTVWTPFVYSNGGSWFNDDYSEFTLNSPEGVEALQNMADLRLVDGVAPPLDIADSIGWDVMIQSRRVAMFIDGTWNIPVLMDAWGDDLGLAVLPAYDEYKTVTFNDPLVIGKDTDNPELAFEFVRFATHPDNALGAAQVSGAVPTYREYLSGDKLEEWLALADRPGDFAEVVVENVNHSGPLPAAHMSEFSLIEWPVVMPLVMQAFRGEITMQEAMAQAKPLVDQVLSEESD